MDAQFWHDVQAVFAAAADARPEDRPALLDRLCAGRTQVRQQVESLLTSSESAGDDFLAPPADVPRADGPASDPVGQTIGGFRLLEKIGEGGMGSVYLAVREDGDFTQRVAVKLVDLPVSSEDALRRFRSERRILAALNHPHIVTFLDGGWADGGPAYLVMEYVDGVPLTRYCAQRRLGLDDRLRMFQLVCGAVQYAHRHSVVHRDLKPANILVTSAGAPKMLDFGVARLLDAPGAAADVTVGHPLRALTPNYASPEQLRGMPVTTASDLYALGVLLHELLTGVRPYETAGRPLDESLNEVLHTPRRRPSEVTGAQAEAQPPYALSRLRGDLDAVVLKALRVDPAERYASAQEMAADLGRVLAGTPVIAREPSFGYIASHLVRRHRAVFAAAAISVLATLAALGVSLRQTRVAERERARAESRFADARQLATAVIFDIHDAVAKLPGSTPVRQRIVAEALSYLERLRQDPAGDPAFRLEMARAYFRLGTVQGAPSVANLGDRVGARDSFLKAVAILEPLAAEPGAAPDAAYWLGDVQVALAGLAQADGRLDEQRARVEAVTRIAESLVARDDDSRARRLLATSYFFQAQLLPNRERIDAWTRASAAFERILADQPGDPAAMRSVALVAKYLGSTYELRGEYAAALVQHQRALALDQERLRARPDDRVARFDVAIDLSNLAFAAWKTGALERAADGYARSLALREALVADDPQDVQSQGRLAYVLIRLARVYGDLKQFEDAMPLARRAVGISERLSGIDDQHAVEYAAALTDRGLLELAASRRTEACASFRAARRVIEPLTGETKGPAVRVRLDEELGRLEDVRTTCAP